MFNMFYDTFRPDSQKMSKAYVIVVEDEADLREAVVDYLSHYGLEVTGVGDGQGLRAAVALRAPAVVVLDIGLPGEDGLSLCRWVRRSTEAGIIMASGAGQAVDRVVGLEVGADDYVVKPYDLRELLARIRSLSRRLERAPVGSVAAMAVAAVPEPVTSSGMIRLGRYRLDKPGRRLTDAAGHDVALTANEFNLLLVLAERAGRVVSREDLSELVQGRAFDTEDRSIDISITRLRKKIETDPSRPQLIRTVRGEGYRCDPDAD